MFERERRKADASTDAADGAFWHRTAPWGERRHDLSTDEPSSATTRRATDESPVISSDAPTVPAPRPARHDGAAAAGSPPVLAPWTGRVDPLVVRLAAIVVVALAAVPVAWWLRDTTAAAQYTAGEQAAAANASGPGSDNQLVSPLPVITEVAMESTSSIAGPTAATPRSGDRSAATAQVAAATVTVAEAASTVAPATTAVPATTSAPVVTTAPAPAARAVEMSCSNEYTLVRGDSWIRLSERTGVDVDRLLDINGADLNTMLYAGEEICLPAGVRVVVPTTAPPATSAPTTAAPATTAVPTSAPATTAAPTTTTPVRLPTAPSRAEAEAIIREVWPAELADEAVRIAIRESNLWANAQNWCCVGLFQIYWEVHDAWLGSVGVTERVQLFDARTNVVAAYALYQRAEAAYGDGWSPWALG